MIASFRQHIVCKVIALMVSFTFIWQSVGPVAEAEDAYAATLSSDSRSIDIPSIKLPASIGEVIDSSKGNIGKTIIHIRDAHCDYSAQNSISGLVGYFRDKHGIKLVALEGGVGDYDLSVFTDIKDASLREKTADYFVKQGEVNGAEFYAINNPAKVMLYGVEDPELYQENLSAYMESLKFKDDAQRLLKILSATLPKLKSKIYPANFKQFDEKVKLFKEDKISFEEYAAAIADFAKKESIDLSEYPNISRFYDVMDHESGINMKEAEHQRNILIDLLNKKLSKKYIEELVAKTVEFNDNVMPATEYYAFLLDKAKLCGIDMEKMPDLVSYAQCADKTKTVNKKALEKEFKLLDQKMCSTFLKTEEARELCSLDRRLFVLERMFSTTLVKDDWDYYSANREMFDTKNFPLDAGKGLGKLDDYRKDMEKFYDISLKRDDIFIDKIAARLKKEKQNNVVLVTGGFHQDNLRKLFEDKGYSYVEVLPRIEKTDGENPYFRLLSGGADPIARAIRESQSNLQIATFLDPSGLNPSASSIKRAVRVVEKLLRNQEAQEGDIRFSLLPFDGAELLKVKGEDGKLEQVKVDGRPVYVSRGYAKPAAPKPVASTPTAPKPAAPTPTTPAPTAPVAETVNPQEQAINILSGNVSEDVGYLSYNTGMNNTYAAQSVQMPDSMRRREGLRNNEMLVSRFKSIANNELDRAIREGYEGRPVMYATYPYGEDKEIVSLVLTVPYYDGGRACVATYVIAMSMAQFDQIKNTLASNPEIIYEALLNRAKADNRSTQLYNAIIGEKKSGGMLEAPTFIHLNSFNNDSTEIVPIDGDIYSLLWKTNPEKFQAERELHLELAKRIVAAISGAAVDAGQVVISTPEVAQPPTGPAAPAALEAPGQGMGKGVIRFVADVIFGQMKLMGINITPARRTFVEDIVVPIIEEGLMGLTLLFGSPAIYAGIRIIFALLHIPQDRAPPLGVERNLYQKTAIPAIISAISLAALCMLGPILGPVGVIGVSILAHSLANTFVSITGSSLQKANIGSDLVTAGDIVTGDGWRPLSYTVAFMRELLNSQTVHDNAYYSKFTDDSIFRGEAEKTYGARSMVPARVDTYIYNQAMKKEQALVELIANGQDATANDKTIGRFGVGAYQMFQELRGPEDSIVITTSTDGKEAIQLTFRLVNGVLSYKVGTVTEGVQQGTRIEVNRPLSDTEARSRIDYIRSKLRANSRGAIKVNGEIINNVERYFYINGVDRLALPEIAPVEVSVGEKGYVVTDRGRGMSAQVLFEKFLVPKSTTKALEGKPVEKPDEIRYETKIFYSDPSEEETDGVISIQVSGVANVDIPIHGMSIPKEMIIELPHDVWLPESRDRVALDELTINGLIQVMNKLVDPERDIKDRYSLLNGMAILMESLLKDSRDKSLLYEFRRICAKLVKAEQARGNIILPNRKLFRSIVLPAEYKDKVIYLDENLFEFVPSNLPNAYLANKFISDTHALYVADLDTVGDNDVYIEGKYPNGNGWIILDRKTYERHKDDPWLVDLLFNFNISYGDTGNAFGHFREEEREGIGYKDKVATTIASYNKIDEDTVQRLKAEIFDENTKKLLEMFDEKDRRIIIGEIEEGIRNGSISESDTEKIKKELREWLNYLLKVKNMISGDSEAVLTGDWVRQKLFSTPLLVFDEAADRYRGDMIRRFVGGKLYFWYDEMWEDGRKIYELGPGGEAIVAYDNAEFVFLNGQTYLLRKAGDSETFRLEIVEEGQPRALLDDVIGIDEKCNEGFITVLAKRGNDVAIYSLQGREVKELCCINKDVVLHKKSGGQDITLGSSIPYDKQSKLLHFHRASYPVKVFVRGERIFITINGFYGSGLYEVTQGSNIVLIKDSSFETIRDIKILSSGNVVVYSKMLLPSIIGKKLDTIYRVQVFDKNWNSIALRSATDSTYLWERNDHIYFDVKTGDGSLMYRISPTGSIEILTKDGFQAEGTGIIVSKINFIGDYAYMYRAISGESYERLIRLSLISGKVEEVGETLRSLTRYFRSADPNIGDGAYYITGFSRAGLGPAGSITEFHPNTLVLVDKGGAMRKIDFEGILYDVYSDGESVYTVETVEQEGMEQYYRKVRIWRIGFDGSKEVVFSAEGVLSEDRPDFVHRQDMFSIGLNDECVTFDTKTGKAGKIIPPQRLKGSSGRMIFAGNDFYLVDNDGRTIRMFPSVGTSLANNEKLRRNIELLNTGINKEIIDKYAMSLDRYKIMSLLLSLQNNDNWMPGMIFLHNSHWKMPGIEKLKDLFNSIMLESKDVSEIDEAFNFIDYTLASFKNTEMAIRIIERWGRIFLKNDELAKIIMKAIYKDVDIQSDGEQSYSYKPYEVYNKNPDKIGQLPDIVRLYLDFLTKDELSAPGIIEEEIFRGEPYSAMISGRDLSTLIRLRLAFPDEVSDRSLRWDDVVRLLYSLKDPEFEGIKREVSGAVNGQDKVHCYWIRELAQNARDAVREVAGIKAKSGFLGHGFYTLFAGKCDEVRIRTGNGQATYELVLKPRYDAKGDLIDIQISRMKKYDSAYKGTCIQRVNFYKSAADEDAVLGCMYVTSQAMRFLGAIPSEGENGVTIELNGSVINEDGYRREDANRVIKITNGMSKEANDAGFYEWIAGVEDPVGMDLYTVINKLFPPDVSGKPAQSSPVAGEIEKGLNSGFSNGNIPRVTVDDLYVDEVDNKYTSLIPPSVLEILSAHGWNIRFPQGTPVTRTRNGVMYAESYAPWIAALALKALVKLYLTGEGVDIKGLGLPKDYIYSDRNGLHVLQDTLEDAERINSGRPESVDYAKYKDNPHMLAQLLTLIKVDFGGEATSISGIKSEVLGEYSKGRPEQVSLEGILPAGMESQRASAEAFIKGRISSIRVALTDQMLSEAVIRAYMDFLKKLGMLMNVSKNINRFECVFRAPSDATAGGNVINWNLAYYHANIGPFVKFMLEGASGKIMSDVVQTFGHETGHTVEDEFAPEHGNMWTHQAEQDIRGSLGWIMKLLFTRMVKNSEPMKDFRDTIFRETGISQAELKASYERLVGNIEEMREKVDGSKEAPVLSPQAAPPAPAAPEVAQPRAPPQPAAYQPHREGRTSMGMLAAIVAVVIFVGYPRGIDLMGLLGPIAIIPAVGIAILALVLRSKHRSTEYKKLSSGFFSTIFIDTGKNNVVKLRTKTQKEAWDRMQAVEGLRPNSRKKQAEIALSINRDGEQFAARSTYIGKFNGTLENDSDIVREDALLQEVLYLFSTEIGTLAFSPDKNREKINENFKKFLARQREMWERRHFDSDPTFGNYGFTRDGRNELVVSDLDYLISLKDSPSDIDKRFNMFLIKLLKENIRELRDMENNKKLPDNSLVDIFIKAVYDSGIFGDISSGSRLIENYLTGQVNAQEALVSALKNSVMSTSAEPIRRYLEERGNSEEAIDRFLRMLRDNKKLFLEVGCGNAEVARELAERNKDTNVLAIDLYDGSTGLYKGTAEAFNRKRLKAQNTRKYKNLAVIRADAGILEHLPEEMRFNHVLFNNPVNQVIPEVAKYAKRLNAEGEIAIKYLVSESTPGSFYFPADQNGMTANVVAGEPVFLKVNLSGRQSKWTKESKGPLIIYTKKEGVGLTAAPARSPKQGPGLSVGRAEGPAALPAQDAEIGAPLNEALHAYVAGRDISGMRIADMGCGTGGGAIKWAQEGAIVDAIEISEEALKPARQNFNSSGLDQTARARIRPVVSDLFASLQGERYDIIAFAPPLLNQKMPGIADATSKRIAQDKDFDIIRRFMKESAGHLEAGGRIVLVYGYDEEPLDPGRGNQSTLKKINEDLGNIWEIKIVDQRAEPPFAIYELTLNAPAVAPIPVRVSTRTIDTVEVRAEAICAALKSEMDSTSRDPVSVIGLPWWLHEELEKKNINSDAYLATLEIEVSRMLGRKGFGDPTNMRKVKLFFISKDAAETKKNLQAVLKDRLFRNLETEQRIVIFVPQIEGVKVEIDEDLLKDLGDKCIQLPDAYSDIGGARRLPDIDARMTIARLTVWCAEAEAGKTGAQGEALKALTDFISAISDGPVPPANSLSDLLGKIKLLMIRPVDYKDLDDWRNSYEAVAKSL